MSKNKHIKIILISLVIITCTRLHAEQLPLENEITKKQRESTQLITKEQDVSLIAQSIIFARKKTLISEHTSWIQQAQKIEFCDQNILPRALDVAAALDILELYAMGLDGITVYEANTFYKLCFNHWANYSKETQAVLTKIYMTLKKYF